MLTRIILIMSCWCLFNGYVLIRLMIWAGMKFRWWMLALPVVPVAVWIAAKIAYYRSGNVLAGWVDGLMNNWNGWMLLALLAVAAFEIVVRLTPIRRPWPCVGALGLSLAMTVFALVQARRTAVRFETLEADLPTAMRIVHLADLHLGYTSRAQLRRVVDKIVALEPDALIITGDVIDRIEDAEFEALDEFERVAAPIVFTTGNHEAYPGLDRVVARLNETLLQPLMGGASVELPLPGRSGAAASQADAGAAPRYRGVRVYGLEDCPTTERMRRGLAGFEVADDGHYDILGFHRPLAPHLAAERGFELMLSGHTHNGQIQPFGLIVHRMFPHIYGLHEVGGMMLNVTSGAGYWGPSMRFPRSGEIVCLDLRPPGPPREQ